MMGGRFRRYVDKVRAEDPDGYLAMAGRLNRAVRPFLGRRGYATALFALGIQYYRANRYPAALAAFDEALRLRPRPAVPALERFLRMARVAPGDLTPFLREAAKALATAQERWSHGR
jgi:tetratricopeptide (TPR) repeat protein